MKEQEIEISKMFFNLNCKGNGRITKNEFEEGLKQYMDINDNITSYINELFEYLNDNNDDCMEYAQFMMGWLQKEMIMNDDYLKYAFDFFDRNNKGVITNEDLIYAFNTYTKCVGKKRNDVNKEEIVINIMKEIDEENKGNIDYTKFKQIMSNYFQVFQIL
jgi:calcium-dependent protein kinase